MRCRGGRRDGARCRHCWTDGVVPIERENQQAFIVQHRSRPSFFSRLHTHPFFQWKLFIPPYATWLTPSNQYLLFLYRCLWIHSPFLPPRLNHPSASDIIVIIPLVWESVDLNSRPPPPFDVIHQASRAICARFPLTRLGTLLIPAHNTQPADARDNLHMQMACSRAAGCHSKYIVLIIVISTDSPQTMETQSTAPY